MHYIKHMPDSARCNGNVGRWWKVDVLASAAAAGESIQ